MAAMALAHAGDHAGHRDRAGPVNVAVVLDPRPGEDVGCSSPGQRIILDAQTVRRAHAIVDHLIAVLSRTIEHHRAAAAWAVHPGLDHAQRKAGGDHRVQAIAAGGKHGRADFGCFPRLRRNNAALAGNGGFAGDLAVGELVVHGSRHFSVLSCPSY